ncbi:MAGUK p55 subfamily member 6 [Triplophysa tibetana]|uniref:MAGUK p55 subfamily member 6 n=1 Tax=Triplophysa tibetana TaxID=1572043 RepID=A0A5A9N3B1_9TELE|nr:MAGUK p55 subfamily member 6 [Triplophysa tibetana]
MPGLAQVSSLEPLTAMQQVLDNLKELPPSTGAKDIDLIFLRGIMESPIVRSLAKAHERLEDVKLEAVRSNNVELVSEILSDVSSLISQDESAAELCKILKEPHFQSLLEAHDKVASKSYDAPRTSTTCTSMTSSSLMPADTVRMISIQKKAGEPLGVTFRVEEGDLVIARVMHGSMIDRQGMLHVGDVIREVNGRDVGIDPMALQHMLRDCNGSITLKILPSYKDTPPPAQGFAGYYSSLLCPEQGYEGDLWPDSTLQEVRTQNATMLKMYLKPHFNYNPETDKLIPCKEAGLAFSKGDILHIVNKEDPNWWQAFNINGGHTGLIPSQFLEEKRKAFVRRDLDGSGILCGTLTGKKKKKKVMYLTAKNAEFDRHELQIYEEVAKMPPFQRKTLVLIGAQGVGRRSLKNRLIILNPLRYGTTVPFTSRHPRDDEKDGQSYCFVSRAEMEADIKASRYLEHGEYDGNLYGTNMDSIHEVVQTSRTCILDVNPQALKVLKTSEFTPFVVFIAAPEKETLREMHKAVVDAGITTKLLTETDLKKTVDESAKIKRAYSHYFDLTIVNDNLDKAFEKLQAAVEQLTIEPQWVPVNWVY